ncbi:MAG: hypothetical protein ACOC0L_00175 [bacterium]
MARLTRSCRKEFERHVTGHQGDGPLPWLHVRIGSGRADPKRSKKQASSYTVTLTTDDGFTAAVDAIMRGLLSRYCGRSLPDNKEADADPFAWIVAGLSYRVRFANTGLDGAGNPRYAIIEDRIRAGELPPVEVLLQSFVPPREELLYRLYALHCRLLLDILMSMEDRERPPFALLLQLLGHGRPSVDALRYVASTSMKDHETLSEWIHRQAIRIIRSGREPASPAWLAQSLAEAEVVTLVLPGQDGIAQRSEVPISKLGDVLETQKSRHSLAAQLEADFNRLIRMAPPLLREALVEYAKTFDLLRSGRKRQYARAVSQAEDTAWAALRRYQELVRYLHDVERQSAEFEQLYPFHRHAVQQWEKRRQNLLPEFQEMLDNAGTP